MCQKQKWTNNSFYNTKKHRTKLLLCCLYVTDPVYLKVRHRHLEHKDKTVRFNISCNGRQVSFTTILFNTWVFCSQINSPGFTDQWRIQGRALVPPYFETKLRPEGLKKYFFETTPPPLLSQDPHDRGPPSPHLKIWIRHCRLNKRKSFIFSF